MTSPWNWASVGLLLSSTAMAQGGAPGPPTSADLAAGDAAWERRAEGHDGPVPRPEPVRQAITSYERVIAADPDDDAARIKLLRALYFLGEYATGEKRAKVAVFERGREVAEIGIDRLTAGFGGEARPRWDAPAVHEALAAHLTDRPDAVGIYLWAANHWALWGRYRGPLSAARQGAAGHIRDYAQIVIALDPAYDRGGGPRVLGRLHHEAPRVPLVTGWIDRKKGLAELTRAVELAPGDLLNRLYWIESVIDHDKGRRGEAIEELRRLVEREPSPVDLIEELNVLVDGRELLAELDG